MEPMEFLIFINLSIIIWNFVVSSINLSNEIKRTNELEEICLWKGWEFFRKGKTAQLNNLLHFYLFSFGSFQQITNLLYSKAEEVNTAIFDYRIKIGNNTSEGNQGIATVIYFRSPLLNLPNFNLLRKPHLTSNTFGDQEVAFDSNSEFSDKYSLLTDDEAAVRRVFGDRLIDYFAQKRTLNVEGSGDRLIIYCSDGLVQPDRIDAFLEEGYRVLELFKESSNKNGLAA